MRALVITAATLAATPALAGGLEEDLAARKARLVEVSQKIDAALGPDFTVTRQVQLKLKTSVLQGWIGGVSTPNFTVKARGTKAEGDLLYKPGQYKLWFKTPQDEQVDLVFAPFQLTSQPGRIDLTSHLTGHVEARIFAHAGGIETNVFCKTNPDVTASVRAVFAVGAPTSEAKLPYVLTLTEPASLKARVTCYFSWLGNYSVDFPIDNLAKELSRGEFDLGYKDTFEIELPGSPPSTIAVKFAAKNQAVAVDAEAIEVGADVEVSH